MAIHVPHSIYYEQQIADSLSLARFSASLAGGGTVIGLLASMPGLDWSTLAVLGWAYMGLGLVLTFLLLVIVRRDRLRLSHQFRKSIAAYDAAGTQTNGRV